MPEPLTVQPFCLISIIPLPEISPLLVMTEFDLSINNL